MSDLEKRARMLWVLLGAVQAPEGIKLIDEAFNYERKLALEEAASCAEKYDVTARGWDIAKEIRALEEKNDDS